MHKLAAVLVLLGVVIPSFASAQTSRPARARADSQSKSSKDVHITLEMQWLGLNDNCVERLGVPGLKMLPKVGSHAIYDQQQTDLLLRVANGDRRSSVNRIPTITVPSGEAREVSPFALLEKSQGTDTIRATSLSDQGVQIELTCGKQKDGEAYQPAKTVAVPVGSHLLVCTADTFTAPRKVIYSPSCSSFWQSFKNRVFGTQPTAVGWERERLQVCLLVTPRITSQEQDQQQASVK